MSHFSWSQAFATGHDEIDRHHRRLFELANQLGSVVEHGGPVPKGALEKLVGELAAYARYHFAAEEELMVAAAVDSRHLDTHRGAHRDFARRLTALLSDLPDGDVSGANELHAFLTQWLVGHVLLMDHAMQRQIDAIDRGASPGAAYESDQSHAEDGAVHALLDTLRSYADLLERKNLRLRGRDDSPGSGLQPGLKGLEGLTDTYRMSLAALQHEADRHIEREAMYRLAVDSSQDGFWLLDSSGRILEVNTSYLHACGYRRDEIVGQRITFVETTETAARTAARIQEVMQAGSARFETSHRKKDGSTWPVEMRITYASQQGGRFFCFLRDTTEQNAAQQRLRQREEQFRRIIEASPVAMALIDAQGCVRYLNPVFTRVFGYDLGDIPTVNAWWPKAYPDPDYRKSVAGEWTRRLGAADATRTPFEPMTVDVVAKSGERRCAMVNTAPVDGTADTLTLVTFYDITKQRQISERLRTILESAGDGIHILDPEGNVVDCSSSFAQLLGYTREEALRLNVRDWDDLVHDGERVPTMDALLARAAAFETVHRRKDGSTFPAEVNAKPIQLEGRTYLYASTRDITERKRSEKAIRESEQRYRSTIDLTGTGWVVVDATGHVLDANEAYAKLAGAGSVDRIRGRSVLEWTAPESVQTNTDAMAITAEKGFIADFETSYVHPDGQRVDISINAMREQTPAGPQLVALCRDITERRRAQAALAAQASELTQANRELERSNRDLEQFAYIASHDLQEPLRMVASFTGLLQKRYHGRLDKDADEFIGFAVDGAKRMKALIQDLLAYSRAGGSSVAAERVSIAAVVQRARANLRAAIEDSGAQFEIAPSLPELSGRPGQLEQLMQNLFANAIKFRGAQPPQIRVGAERQGAFWRITVADNGIGIAPEFHDKVFAPFKRLHSAAQYPGTGIGLAVCRRVVEAHGGEIGVDSAPEQGSSFWFTLPARAAAA